MWHSDVNDSSFSIPTRYHGPKFNQIVIALSFRILITGEVRMHNAEWNGICNLQSRGNAAFILHFAGPETKHQAEKCLWAEWCQETSRKSSQNYILPGSVEYENTGNLQTIRKKDFQNYSCKRSKGTPMGFKIKTVFIIN